jgi:hypothetical protein
LFFAAPFNLSATATACEAALFLFHRLTKGPEAKEEEEVVQHSKLFNVLSKTTVRTNAMATIFKTIVPPM